MTKIIATLGPASEDPKIIEAMIERGVQVFRFNFSHASAHEYEQYYRLIHDIGRRKRKKIGAMVDLRGPRIRVGELGRESRTIRTGTTVVLGPQGQAVALPITEPSILQSLEVGDPILIDNGLIELRTSAVERSQVHARVIRGGIIRRHKGINLPRSTLHLPAITRKDEEDVLAVLGIGVEYIALSFIKEANDIESLRTLLHNHPVKIVAKIERAAAIHHFDEIAKAADLIMIARGDLGIELPPEEIPALQRELIGKTHHHRKPVVVATQLLSNMIHSPRPSRAEMTDIVTAVQEGADYLLVSDETAIGEYPVEVIEYLQKGIKAASKGKR